MAFKLAFSTVACPQLTVEEVVRQAKEWGYQGIELRTRGLGGSDLASDPALTEPAKIVSVFEKMEIDPVCVSTEVSLHHRDSTRLYQATVQLKRDLELAAALGAKAVRIFADEVDLGEDRREVIQRVARNVHPLVDLAAELGVQILFENTPAFGHAKWWWWLLNLIEHPMIGVCWNVANAAAVGELSSISVPNLNSRIKLVKVQDVQVGTGTGYVPLGEGDVGIQDLIKRLMGIGYEGYLTVEWDRLWLPSLAPAEEYLPDALSRLHGWFEEIAEIEEKGRKVSEKAAARNAPKPAVKS